MPRFASRITLALALILSLGVAGFSLYSIGNGISSAWATLAASLAVLTSMISAWGTQRVVELEEDKLRPYPYPCFDATSRYGLLLLRVTNHGGGAAHNIRIAWDEPLKNSKGKAVQFSPDVSEADVSVLLPGQSVSTMVDGYIDFFGTERMHHYAGSLHFRDGGGKNFKHRFVLDAEMYKDTPLYDRENLKTHYQLQHIPDHLKKLSAEVQRIRQILEKGNDDNA